MSELLANLTYNKVYNSSLHIQYVAPVFGWATCFFYLLIAKEIVSEKGSDSNYFHFLYRLSFLAAGISMLYYFGYIENTPLSVPFSLLYLYFSIKYLKHNNQLFSLFLASLFLSVACLFHGLNTFLIPSLYIFIIIKGIKKSDFKNIIREIMLSAIVFLSMITITFFIAKAMGYQISPGNIHGGGDLQRFVPLSNDNSTCYTRFLMFSYEHFCEISNIVIHSAPAILILSILFAFKAVNRSLGWFFKNQADSAVIATGVMALCYLPFILLWNFDLGFPGDLDLMLSLGFSLNIFIYSMMYNLPVNKKVYLTAGVIFGLCFNVIFLSFFLIPRV